MDDSNEKKSIAVAIPCHDEAETVATVIEGFARVLPDAEIHVFDNASTDSTAEIARRSGAQVHPVPRKGKGNVVRAMFATIDADYLVMVDGDATYPPEAAASMLDMARSGKAHMIVGARTGAGNKQAFRRMHVFGNRLIVGLINLLFGSRLTDALSGLRVFRRDLYKSLPVLSGGFEVETEMTLNALDQGFVIAEIPITYYQRPEGSESKLNTYKDGALLLWTIFSIFKDFRPLIFFGTCGFIVFTAGIGFGLYVIAEFSQTGAVQHPSTAALAASLCVAGLLAIATGFILDSVRRYNRSLQQLLGHRTGVTRIKSG